MKRLTNRCVEPNNDASVSALARQRRWDKFTRTFPSISDMHVLDLGGTPDFWRSAPTKPNQVTLVNMRRFEGTDALIAIEGDACAPPAKVLDTEYDLVVSNSLIEHVGGHAQRGRLATIIRDVAPRHWVQTPYRYFPIEPHWFFPALQFLPFAARVEITMRWRMGHRFTSDRKEAIDSVHEVDLIGITQMANYFPESTIWREKFWGLTKSLVAICVAEDSVAG